MGTGNHYGTKNLMGGGGIVLEEEFILIFFER